MDPDRLTKGSGENGVVSQTVYSELGEDAETPRAGLNMDLVAPDVCPTSSQNLQLKEQHLLLFCVQ